jgi:hypothetical protein
VSLLLDPGPLSFSQLSRIETLRVSSVSVDSEPTTGAAAPSPGGQVEVEITKARLMFKAHSPKHVLLTLRVIVALER